MTTLFRSAIVLAGQSNAQTFKSPAVGYPGGWTSDGNIQIWAGSPTASAWSTYDPATNANPTSGGNMWGPEAGFALAWRADRVDPLYIIKRAIGNAGMLVGDPGSTPAGRTWSCHDSNSEFSLLRDDIVNAVSALSPSNISLDIQAVIWIGNESDTADAVSAGKVQEELEDWLSAFRIAVSRPNAKGIVVATKNALPNNLTYVPVVRAAQRYVGSLPNNCYVDEDPSLSFEGTAAGSHLVTTDVVKLGGMIYRQFKMARTRLLTA